MRLLQTLALLVGWLYFLIVGTVMYALTMTCDSALAIYKVWSK